VWNDVSGFGRQALNNFFFESAYIN